MHREKWACFAMLWPKCGESRNFATWRLITGVTQCRTVAGCLCIGLLQDNRAPGINLRRHLGVGWGWMTPDSFFISCTLQLLRQRSEFWHGLLWNLFQQYPQGHKFMWPLADELWPCLLGHVTSRTSLCKCSLLWIFPLVSVKYI